MIEVVTDDELPPAPPPPGVEVDAEDIESDEEKPEAKPEKEKRAPAQRETKAMSDLRNNTDNALKEWMESLSPNGGVKVRVIRTSPKVWKGLNVGGSLATYDHYIDEDWIREHHGGGNYMLEVKKPRTNGTGWQIAGSRAIQIAGDPRTDDVFRDGGTAAPVAAAPPANDTLIKAAFGSMERQLERAQQQQAGGHNTDAETMRMILQPMQAQLDQFAAMLREKDRQLAAAQQVKPVERDEFRDRMLATMMEGDSARLTTLREQHASELRQLKQSAIDNEQRLRDGFERDKDALARAHERELNTLRSAGDMKVMSQETLASATRTLMEGEVRRLQADLTEAKSELAALRLKKDKSPIETMTEMAQLKEAMGEILGDDSKEKSTMEKVFEAAGPMVQGALAKFGEQAPPQPAPQQVAVRVQQPKLLTGPDGNLYRQLPNGELQMVRKRAPAAPKDPTQPNIPEIPATTIKLAVDFLESAFRNNQDPAEVATSVRSMIPADVLTAIRELGIDGFLTNVAKLDGTSALSGQAGRNWTRKLGKSLLEG